VWHTFTCSPKELGVPGSEYFAGTNINPKVTWFQQAAPFMTYLGRCQPAGDRGHKPVGVRENLQWLQSVPVEKP